MTPLREIKGVVQGSQGGSLQGPDIELRSEEEKDPVTWDHSPSPDPGFTLRSPVPVHGLSPNPRNKPNSDSWSQCSPDP